MTIHVGICQIENTLYVSAFDTNDQITNFFSIYETNENEQFDFSIIFDEIRSTFKDELGCCCIYLDENYDNEYRKECVDFGVAFGFKNVEILNFYGNQYLQAVFNANYKVNECEAIWIAEQGGTYVWEKVNDKAQFVVWLPWSPTTKTEFNKFEVAAEVHKRPSVIFYHPEITVDRSLMNEYFPNAKIFICERYSNLNISLVKARIMAGDSEISDFDFKNPMRSEVSIWYANKKVMSFNEFQSLPCKKSIKVVKINEEKDFKMSRGNRIDLISFPDYNRFLLTVSFDINEIYSFNFEEIPQYSADTETETFYLKMLNKASNELLPSRNTLINAVGIDFGTASFYAAVNRLNGIEAIPLDNTGQRSLASYVSFDEEIPKCGKIVIDRLRHHSKSSVYDLKKLVGKNYDEIDVNSAWPFHVVPSEDNKFCIEFQRHNTIVSRYPEEILSVLLKHIKQKAEDFKGVELKEVVITVPHNFKVTQRNGIHAAALLAGWKSVYLLPEPIAVVFAYSIETQFLNLNTVLVVDYGSENFSACILKIVNEEVIILSNRCDYNITGSMFDNIIFDYYEEKLYSKFGIKIVETGKQKLMKNVQQTKETLSWTEEASLNANEFDNSIHDRIYITRAEFEARASSLLSEIKDVINDTVCQAKVSHIDKILYAGGSCRIPMIQKSLKEIFSTSQHCFYSFPEEVNAIGAAYCAYNLNLSTRQIGDSVLRNNAIMRLVLKQPHLIKRLLSEDVSDVVRFPSMQHGQLQLIGNPLGSEFGNQKIDDERSDIKLQNQNFKLINPLINEVSYNAVGVDFGATCCHAAVNRRNGVETVALDNIGQRNLASYVSYDEENPKCGQIVIDRLRNYSRSSIYDMKLFIGCDYSNIPFNTNWPFHIRPINERNFHIRVQGPFNIILKTSEEIVAVLFNHIKLKIEEFQGKNLTEVVITVPYGINKKMKDEIHAAALLAGWKSVHLLPEPIAAIFGYFLEKPIPNLSNILVVDFGGGSLKICVFEIINDEIVLINHHSNHSFNGKRFDQLLADWIEIKLRVEFAIIINDNKRYKLIAESKRIKEDLSFTTETCINVDEFDVTKEGTIIVTRQDLENRAYLLKNEIKNVIRDTVNIRKLFIHKILYVGGGCRMPMIKNLLKELFGTSEHYCHSHPDEIISVGAACYAYYLNLSTKKISDVNLNNILLYLIFCNSFNHIWSKHF